MEARLKWNIDAKCWYNWEIHVIGAMNCDAHIAVGIGRSNIGATHWAIVQWVTIIIYILDSINDNQ